MYHFIAIDAFQALSHAERSPGAPTSTERLEFASKAKAAARTGVGTATIHVAGVLTKRPSLLAMLFGGGNTTYAAIADALKSADADPSVSDIVLHVDSPGGEVDGLFSLLDVMGTIRKPMVAKAENATSAAYAIAAATSKIEATNAGARFGSVGVVANVFVENDMVTITSTEAPDKRPDVQTDAGRATVRKQLDDLHSLFVQSIARGRNTTVQRVNAEFGRGGVILAQEARRLGMIDALVTPRRKLTAAMAEVAKGQRPGESHDDFIQRCTFEPADETGDVNGSANAAQGDIGDQVVAIMRAQRAGRVDTATGIADAQRVGSQRPTGDLGDQVVAIMRQRRGQAGAT